MATRYVPPRLNPLLSPQRPLIMAHRGDQTVSPENTLLALKNASLLEIDYIETDIRMTKDRELVLFHDESLERTTNASGNLINYSLEDLKEVDLGYNFTLNGGKTFPSRGKEWRIVTLRQAFDLFPHMKFNLDIKNQEPEAPQLLANIIQEYDRDDTVLVGSFHHQQIERFRKILPQVKTAASLREVKYFILRERFFLNWMMEPKFFVLQIPVRFNDKQVLTPKLVKAAHSKSIAVHVWTINDRSTMEWLINLKVDGIFTDDPWLLLEALQEKGLI